MGDTVLVLATLDMPLVLATLDTAMLLLPTDTMELTAMLPQLPVLELLSVDMEPLPQSEPTLHTAMLPADNMLLTPLELSILPRERPRLNQRLMLMLSMEIMDMVLVTLLDTVLATPDPLSPVMLLQLLLPQLLQAMLLQSSPDQLLPAMLLQSSPDQLLMPQLLPAMLPQLLPLLLLLLQLLPAMLPQLLPLAMLVLPDPLFPAMPVMDMDVSTKLSTLLC